MKLLSVIVTMNPVSGGPAQGIRNNIPLWEENGITTTVVTFDNPDAEFVQNDNIIALGPVNNSWAFASGGMHWLLKNLPNYNVVLIHGLWLYNGYAVTKAVKQLKRSGKEVPKVFVMPHGMLDPYFQNAPERRLKSIRNVIYWHLIEKYVINNADGVLFTCEEELQLAATTFSGYKPKAVYNVGYGILPPPLYSDKQPIAFYDKCEGVKNRPYFLFLSRIHPKKGVDILLEAYAKSYTYCIEKKIELPDLVIAGPGLDTDYGTSLKMLQQQYPAIAQKIHYPGMLQGNAKWGALYGAELFVLPSHQENFGIAIVEAMACKTPVLITNRVNIWREIEQGGGGIVVGDNLESIQSALQTWLDKTTSNKEVMGSKAFNTYHSHFTVRATNKKFIEKVLNK